MLITNQKELYHLFDKNGVEIPLNSRVKTERGIGKVIAQDDPTGSHSMDAIRIAVKITEHDPKYKEENLLFDDEILCFWGNEVEVIK